MITTNSIIRQWILATGVITLCGCSIVTGSKHSEDQLLPDGGDTTMELMTGKSKTQQYYGDGNVAAYVGENIQPNYQSVSSYTNAHIDELKRDFKRVPNPEIIGYVYPHITNNKMPVPGYYTTFTLYDRTHFALSSEGYND